MENKKTKLTISGTPKKPFRSFEINKSQKKKHVIIEKQSIKTLKKNPFFKSKPSSTFNKGPSFKSSFQGKTPSGVSDFERRKLAEQRATKRLKGENETSSKKSKITEKKES